MTQDLANGSGQITSGLRAVLSLPAVYRLFGTVLGGKSGRRFFADRYIRAQPGDRILDIGCGPADILDYLPEVDYLGFDSSAAYIKAARERFGSRAEFLQNTVSEATLPADRQFDIVLAIGVLHHLADDEARVLLATARHALHPGGRFISFDGCYTPRQNPIARLFLKLDRGKNVRDEAAYLALARASFPTVEAHVVSGLIRIPYTHIILEGSAS